MSSLRWLSPIRSFSVVGAAMLLFAGAGKAQTLSAPEAQQTAAVAPGESSSLDYLKEEANPFAELLAPAPANGGGGQYDNRGGGGGGHHGIWSRLTWEAGGGFNAPVSDSSNYITWGGNFTLGGGMRLNKYLSLLAEYQFMDDKLPGAIIAETGADGGNAHIWSFTLAPVVDLMPKKTNSVYITGGGGFYRKVTNFTDPVEEEYCDYYYGYCGIDEENVVIGHFSSNQGGWNIGAGFTHKIGGLYGDGKTKLFAEVRYLDVLTPAVLGQSANGLNPTTIAADTKLIPVTFGIRF